LWYLHTRKGGPDFILARILIVLAYRPEKPGAWTGTTNTPNGDVESVKPCDQNIKETLHLTDKMIELANIGDADREDVGCGILYGILRDAAYKIKKLAEDERHKHRQKGWWDEDRA
jgi:hypothetical protein